MVETKVAEGLGRPGLLRVEKEGDDVADEHGFPSLGELSRSQARIEGMLGRMETTNKERHDVVLRQVSDVRHRVTNLEARETLSKEFLGRVGTLFDRVETLEKREIAEQAVNDFKKYLLGGGFLGLVLIALQIYQLVN